MKENEYIVQYRHFYISTSSNTIQALGFDVIILTKNGGAENSQTSEKGLIHDQLEHTKQPEKVF